jgi:hypothetical protein
VSEQLFLETDDSPQARRSREFWKTNRAIEREYRRLVQIDHAQPIVMGGKRS